MTYYGIALIILGIIGLAGIIYIKLDKKHLPDKKNWRKYQPHSPISLTSFANQISSITHYITPQDKEK